jgi:hypoxia up-regulated 1
VHNWCFFSNDSKMRPIHFPILFLALLSIVLCSELTTRVVRAAVMSVDFGSEFFKVALVKPGIAMEVVLNPKESKRKTENILSIDPRTGGIFVGSEAAVLSTRFPHLSYPYLQTLLGKGYTDPATKQYQDHIYPSDLKLKGHPTRNSVVFELNRDLLQFKDYQVDHMDYMSVEEMIAIILRQAKAYAEHMAKEEIQEAVIAVPRHFTIQERMAMVNSAHLAGLRVLELINEDTAVALQFALTREFTERPQYHIFFDMGGGSTKATIVRFSSIEANLISRPINITLIEIVASEHDSYLNGRLFDKRLQTHLLGEFTKSFPGGKSDIRNSPRPMAKLLREAKRVKETLTVNSHTFASVENLWEDTDLRVQVTRQEFDGLIRTDLARIEGILNRLFKQAGVSFVSP